jgi:hypothetical protein
MEKIALDQETSVEFQVFVAALDAYAAGVKAGTEAAKQARIDQIVKAHRAKQADTDAPPAPI